MIFTDVINQQMHFYKYAQSHVVVLHQYVPVTDVTINKVCYKIYIINMQLYTDCIVIVYIFIIHPGDGQKSDRNILVKNNNM
jgi:hypothetical protein